MTRPYIVYATGGSGGHVYPLVAIQQSFQGKADCLFFVTKGREDEAIIRRYGFSYIGLFLKKSILLGLFFSFFVSFYSFFLKRPVCLVVSGGVATVCVILAAFFLRIPILMLEQNVIPGRTNRWVQWFVTKICLSFSESESFFSLKKCVLTGNPIRQSFIKDDTYRALMEPPWPKLPVLLVVGGSQGASFFTKFFLQYQEQWLKQPWVVWVLAGPAHQLTQKHRFVDFYYDANGVRKMAFFKYSDAMNLLYQRSCVVLSRAGATTIAELMYFQKPAVLVPYPFAKDNHQWHNAQSMVRTKQAICFTQSQCDFERVFSSISLLQTQFQREHLNLDSDDACSLVVQQMRLLNCI